MKITKEDINKYGTDEEKKVLETKAHDLSSACCGAKVLGGGDIVTCSDCGEWCDIYCTNCGKEFSTVDEAQDTPCD